jgi:hypothetical protein
MEIVDPYRRFCRPWLVADPVHQSGIPVLAVRKTSNSETSDRINIRLEYLDPLGGAPMPNAFEYSTDAYLVPFHHLADDEDISNNVAEVGSGGQAVLWVSESDDRLHNRFWVASVSRAQDGQHIVRRIAMPEKFDALGITAVALDDVNGKLAIALSDHF